MPGLFAGAQLSLQTQPSSRAADDEDICERPALGLMAGGAMISFRDIVAGVLIGAANPSWLGVLASSVARGFSSGSILPSLPVMQITNRARPCSVALVLRFRNQRLIKRRRAMTSTGILLALGCVIALLLFALFLWWCFGR